MASLNINGSLIVSGKGTLGGKDITTTQSSDFVAVTLREGEYDANTNAVGYTDFQLSATQKLRHYYGIINVQKSVSFPTPFSQRLWATSVMQPSSDADTQRATITAFSNTGLSFKGGATMATRWEAWGLINS
jgi:hypothetical protein